MKPLVTSLLLVPDTATMQKETTQPSLEVMIAMLMMGIPVLVVDITMMLLDNFRP